MVPGSTPQDVPQRMPWLREWGSKMPFALLFIGILLAVVAYNNTQADLAKQLSKDFSGRTGFVYWIAAILIVGLFGYVKQLETVSRAMLALILVVIFLRAGGFFEQFNAALAGETVTPKGAGENGGDDILDITINPLQPPLPNVPGSELLQ